MTQRYLRSELVALIHHVELSEAGWRDNLIDQLVLSSMFLQAAPCGPEDLRSSLNSGFGVAIDDGAFGQSVKRLVASRSLVEIDAGRIKLSEKAAETANRTISENQSVEQQVAERFRTIVQKEAPALDPDDCWRSFCGNCLDPLVSELGARTYELIAGPLGDSRDIRSIADYIETYSDDVQAAVQNSIDRFLDPGDPDVRAFVLSRLHAHLLTLAASLPEPALVNLASKTKSNLQLKLFLDTNFLFSVLELHDNPGNQVAKDLFQLLADVKNHVSSQLYVFPPTVDEVTRTLSWSQRELLGLEVTPRLGRIATNIAVGQGSGISARFLRAAASATHRLTPEEYFSPYLTDLLAVLRGKGLKLYDENIESLTASQVVVDDILAQQQFEQGRSAKRPPKSYEALRHDVALWHFVSQKRSASVDSPLDAAFWVVTVDYGLLRFDAYKTRRTRATTVPICVHPATLIQMLQLWLPRTPQFDEAMLQCVRALLPRPTATEVETVTLRILRALSRFEDVDDLPEETVTSVLLSRALRARMETANAADEQNALVKEALVDELAVAERKLSEERNVRSGVEDELQDARSRAAELEQEARKEQMSLQAMQTKLRREQESRQDLASRFSLLEKQEARHSAEATGHEKSLRRLHRGLFLAAAILLLGLFGAVMGPGARRIGDLTGHLGLRPLIMMALLILAFWTLVVDLLGQRIGAISTWGPFNLFHRAKTWLFRVLGALAVALLTSLILE